MAKSRKNPKATVKILEAFERVYNGEDPDDILKDTSFENPIGENPEALLKTYKMTITMIDPVNVLQKEFADSILIILSFISGRVH